MAIIISIFLIIMGLVFIFDKDFVWKLQEYSNRVRGIVNSQRTPEWELSATIVGIFGMVVGGLIFVAYI